jgi:hypothetical protein
MNLASNRTMQQLLLSILVVTLVLSVLFILDGPPTLTNQALAKTSTSAYGYPYKPYCYPYPYCSFLPAVFKLFR